MKHITSKNKIILTLISLFLFSPLTSFAMNIEIGKQIEKIPQNETVLLDVYLNSDENEINTIEGSIHIDGDYEIKALSTAGSIFDLWPNKPSFSDGTVSFTGGSSSGFFGSKLKIFSIAIIPLSKKDITFSADNIDVFLNNGIGTKLSTDNLNKTIQISEPQNKDRNDLSELIAKDQKLPSDFQVVIGQDDSIFDGKYFASFNTTDNESGINRYEVIENGNQPIRTGNTYVLQNQDLKGSLIVKAIDNAGNVREVKVNMKDVSPQNNSIHWFPLTIALILLIGIYFVLKFFRRKIKNVQS